MADLQSDTQPNKLGCDPDFQRFSKMINAIIFDFDGTLIDSVDSVYKEYLRVSRIMNLRKVYFEEFGKHLGKPWNILLEELWPGVDIKKFKKQYRTDAEQALPIYGVHKTLEKLKEHYKLGIVTSRGKKTLYRHLKTADIDKKIFDIILYRENLKKHKPNPEALLVASRKMRLLSDEIIYVGDSIIDAQCALSANIRFIGVLTGGASKKEFKKLGVKYIVKSVRDITKIIKKF